MTEQELLRLIEERLPEEWTPAELAQLKLRAMQSDEIRHALAARLEIDEQLSSGLNEVSITLDTILQRAARSRQQAWRRKVAGILGPLGLVVLLLGIGVWLWPRHLVVDNTEVADVEPVSALDALPVVAVVPENPAADAVDALTVLLEPPIAEVVSTKPAPPVPTPMPVEPAPPVGPIEPWTAAYAAKAAVWNANSDQLRLDFAAAGHDDFPEEEARRWWQAVDGQAFNWGQDAVGGKRIARFQGQAKLRLPWQADTLLRMTLLDAAACEFYFWRGNEGISLRYYTTKEPHVWAAYRVTRSDPKLAVGPRIGLITTDNGAFFRSTPGTFDLQVQGERLVLSRGGISLMSVPCGGLPDEVFLEGQCRFRGMSVHRCEPLPLAPVDQHRLVFGDQKPAALTWQQPADSIMVQAPQPDGRMGFRGESAEKSGTAFVNLPQQGLYEVIVQLDGADPGTGFYLGDANGNPLAQIGVYRDQKSQQLTLGLVQRETKDVADHDVAAAPVPYASPTQRLRIIVGYGVVRAWVGGEQATWGQLAQLPLADLKGQIGSFGVSALPGPMPRSLTVKHVEVRELSGLQSLAEAALIGKIPAYAPEELVQESLWMHRSLAEIPAGVEPAAWLDTCAVRTLQLGPQREFGMTLIKRLLDGAFAESADPDRAFAALRDVALLLDLSDELRARDMAERLQTRGIALLEQRELRPSHPIRTAWLQLPIWTISPVKSALDRLVRQELTAAVGRNDWKMAASIAAESQFWNHPVIPATPLVEPAAGLDRLAVWVRAMTADQQAGVAGGSRDALPAAYRHPLIQQFNKEGYNLRAELDAALNSQAFDDACRLVASLGDDAVEGLLPDLRDRQLFVSMPTAVLTALRDYPDFGTAMNREHGATGLVKVRQAIADGRTEVIQAATLQYLGTPAAAEAQRWLGDRQLAAGKFGEAEAHFRFALDSAAAEQRDELRPRLWLAQAWSGRLPAGSDQLQLAGELNLNGRVVTATEFAALIADARARLANQAVAGLEIKSQPRIAPAGYKLEPRGQFDAQPGNNPGRGEYRFGDPFGKQLAYAVDDKFVYLSNRFQINAYDPATGQVKWAQGVGSDQGEAYDFAFHTMRPLVHGDLVYVRRLTRAGAELTCLKKTDGTVVWKQRPMTHVLTDPVFWQGELCALIGGKVEEELRVEFARFDVQSGEVKSTRPVASFRDLWNQAIPCTWAVTERWAACQIGNLTASLTPDGIVRWLRKPTWMPSPVDDLATDFRAPEPVVQGDRLLIAVPGSKSVECLDLPTGRLIWRSVVPELRGLRGARDSLVVADVGDGLWGLDPSNGRVIWRKSLGMPLETWSMDEDRILCARRSRGLTTQQKPNLVWLDLATGKELAQTQLETTDREDWQLGPLVPASGKWWILGGSGWKDHKRELLELVPVTATAPAAFTDLALGHWSPELPDADRHGFASVLPAWFPPVNYQSRWQFVPTDLRGETRLMISRTGENQQPTWLATRLDIPVEPSTLRFRVANQPGQKWRLVVRIENEVVLDQILDDSATSNNWQDVAVDLTRFAGRSALASAMHGPVDSQPSEALWKSIELLKN